MKHIIGIVTAMLLSGCATTASEPTSLADSGIRVPASWSAAPDATTGPAHAWLRQLGDPALPTLVDEALSGNQDLRGARARVRAARARATIAGAAELPRVDASAGAARRGSGASGRRNTVNDFDATLSASWEADLWDRLGDETRAADLDARGSEADLGAARLSLAAGVARGWFDLVEATLQRDLASETVDNFRANLAIVEESFRAGLNSALDVRLERANLAGAESALETRRIDRDLAARSLEVLLGRYPEDRVRAARDLPRLDTPVPAGMPAAILDRRPDLRAARLRLAASDSRLDAALKNRLPELTLTARGGLSSDALHRLLDFDSLLFALAADLAAPLLRGGELEARRELARAETDEALAAYAESVLQAFQEVESALYAEALLARREAALERASRESTAAEELALERYRSGLTDIITWLEARRRAFDARSSLLTVRNERLRTRINLYLALGGNFQAATQDTPA